MSGPLPSAELVDGVVDHLETLSRERAPLRAATCLMEFVSSDTPTISVVSDVHTDVATDNEMIR